MTEDEKYVLNRIQKRIHLLSKVLRARESYIPDYCTLISTIKKRRYYIYGQADLKYSFAETNRIACIGNNNMLTLKSIHGASKFFLFEERERKIAEFAHSLGLMKTKALIDCSIAYNLDSQKRIQDIAFISIGKDADDMPYVLSNEELEMIDLQILRKRELGLEYVQEHGEYDLVLISCSENIYKTTPLISEDGCPCLIGFDFLNRPMLVYGTFAEDFLRNIKEDRPFVEIIEQRLKAYD